jgi:hypothetical protein
VWVEVFGTQTKAPPPSSPPRSTLHHEDVHMLRCGEEEEALFEFMRVKTTVNKGRTTHERGPLEGSTNVMIGGCGTRRTLGGERDTAHCSKATQGVEGSPPPPKALIFDQDRIQLT